MSIELPPIYSYSQLGTYKGCSQKYKNYFIDKNKKKDKSIYTEIGTLVHACIESFYEGTHPSAHDAFKPLMGDYMRDLGILEWRNELEAISDVMKNLLMRASAQYTGPDAIRTGNGDVPKNPAMTSTWKAEIRKHNLERRIDDANNSIARQLPIEYASIKMVDVYTQVDHLTKIYVHPAQIKEVVGIEFAFSEPDYKGNPEAEDPAERVPHIKNMATLPSGRLFRGYIDLVGKLWDGRWAIIDHKTSGGDPPSELKVKHHEQLLLYAYFWHQLTGTWPAKIGISHLRTGTLVLADVVPKLAMEAAARHDEVVNSIDKKVFLKHAPFEFGSPCLNREGGLEGCCPYLKDCHPEVALSLGWADEEAPSLEPSEY